MYVLKYTMSYNISRNIISPLKLGSLTEKHKENTFQRSINFTNFINLTIYHYIHPTCLLIWLFVVVVVLLPLVVVLFICNVFCCLLPPILLVWPGVLLQLILPAITGPFFSGSEALDVDDLCLLR